MLTSDLINNWPPLSTDSRGSLLTFSIQAKDWFRLFRGFQDCMIAKFIFILFSYSFICDRNEKKAEDEFSWM